MSENPTPDPRGQTRRLVIGIDPGITGAMALLHWTPTHGPLLLDVRDMPTASLKSGRTMKAHVIPAAVADIIKDWRAHADWLDTPLDAFLEEVHAMPGQGVTSMFRFGHVAGMLEGIVAALNVPLHKLGPKEWQTRVRVKKEPDAGRARAAQIFPAGAHYFKRKLDHNRADAALIGYAGVQILNAP